MRYFLFSELTLILEITMFRKSMMTSAVLAMTLGLAACGGGGSGVVSVSGSLAVSVGDVVALTASNKLMSFNRASPGTMVGSINITGLASGESLLGIDVRPANNMLYGLGSLGNLYTLVPSTGVATLVAKLTADANDTTAPFTALSGTSFGFDFNPVADRLRVVSDTGLNLRINADTGATTTDTAISATTAVAVSGSAYSNSFAGATNTKLFNLNLATGTLDLQDPNPNAGVLVAGPALGVTATAADFDIDSTNNIGYAALTVGGTSSFYRVNLQDAALAPAATLVGAIAGGEQIKGLALMQTTSVTVTALTTTNGLFTFSPRTPNTISNTVAITGLATGEVILGMDVRPQDGLLWALSSLGRLYTLDATTGAATFKVAISATLDGSQTASVDFNPVANRLRVVTSGGQNLRIAVVDIPAVGTAAAVAAGTTVVDASINRAVAGTTPSVVAAAYSNNFVAVTGFTPGTVLFDMESIDNVLAQQIPPNNGTLVNVGSLGLDIDTFAAFDIAGGANGLALGAVRAGSTGPFLLRSINLMTGAVVAYNFTSTGTATTDALSQIGGASGPAVRDIAISLQK